MLAALTSAIRPARIAAGAGEWRIRGCGRGGDKPDEQQRFEAGQQPIRAQCHQPVRQREVDQDRHQDDQLRSPKGEHVLEAAELGGALGADG